MSWVLLIVMVVLVAAVAYGLYSRTGSGISRHPIGGQEPGEHPERDARVEQAGVDETEGTPIDQRGTDSTGS